MTVTRWKQVRLKNLCVDAGQYGLNISAENYAESGTRLLRTTDISSGALTPKEAGVFVSDPPEERFTLEKGDLLLSRSGTPPGQSYLVRALDEGATFAGYLVRFRPQQGVDPRFLAYIAQSTPFQEKIRAESVASTIQNFNAERYANIEFRAPGPTEQRRIADFLDAETVRLDALAAAMNSQDVSLKQRRLRVLDFASEHAPGTPLVRLGYLSSLVTSGSRGWGDFVSDTGSLFFRSANLHPDRVQPKLTNLVYVQVPAAASSEAQRSRIEPGDVLIGITGANAGWVCMANDEVTGGHVSQHVCLVRPDKHRIIGDWLALLIASPATQSKLMGNQYGGTKTQLSLPDIREIRIPVLSVEQQVQMTHSIKRQIDSIDRQRLLRQRQLALLTERRQALITAAVTGQFDVSTASGRNVTDGVSA
ncbi:restriction endonuclease subunit S [Streptomyces europaeiscabiei]|uniref:restriction endonuclease subunit S n=1 Tax=Streptomyces europaeiscabiei TaxID=146819 RepID=UPI0029ABFF2B|nr:restriction endonuclease subunit S [Streptomyces europaeiscabiei]MDX3693159.1 restriction endonuclease subunit S [Streptomyces europaeiscabiei]